jgi:endonuclease/exonuclease/phosphatase (EEP) superfamily protein YafD
MRNLAIALLAALALGGGLAVAGGLLGAVHAAGDSLAVFRLPAAALAVCGCLGLALLAPRVRRVAAAGAAAVALAAAPAALSYLPPPALAAGQVVPVAIYQKNLRYRLVNPAPVAADILASGAEVVTLQEVHPNTQPVLELLREAYPTQALCPYGPVGGTAVLSRWEALGAPVCPRGGGLTALPLEAPFGRFWAVSVHLYWPWPHGQAPQAVRLAPLLADLDGPVVMGGDFNMVPWASSVRRLAQAAGVRHAGPTASTFGLAGGLLPLAIDHVFLPDGWLASQDLRPRFGSDHRGLLVRFSPPPPPGR